MSAKEEKKGCVELFFVKCRFVSLFSVVQLSDLGLHDTFFSCDGLYLERFYLLRDFYLERFLP